MLGLIVLLIALALVFAAGVFVARHHHAQIDARLDEIHATVKSIRSTARDEVKEVKNL